MRYVHSRALLCCLKYDLILTNSERLPHMHPQESDMTDSDWDDWLPRGGGRRP